MTGRFEPEEMRSLLRPAAWSAPTPVERDAAYARLRAELDAAVPPHLASLAALAVPSVRLRSYLPDRRTPVGTSRLGGRPDLAPNVKWPKYDSAPMAFLAQIRLDDVAAVAPAGALPSAGLLAVFVGLEADGMYPVDEDAVVVLVMDSTNLKRARWPSALDEELRFGEETLLPEAMLSVPEPPPDTADELSIEWDDVVASVVPPAPHHRMLGIPFSLQGYEPGVDRVLLLQIDGDGVAGFSFGDGGNLQITASASALAAGCIEECAVELDSY